MSDGGASDVQVRVSNDLDRSWIVNEAYYVGRWFSGVERVVLSQLQQVVVNFEPEVCAFRQGCS